MTGELVQQPSAGTLAIRANQTSWTPMQLASLAQIGVAEASQGDLDVFLHYSMRTGLDPFTKQIYMIRRKGKWTIQTGIDGFRLIANRTGKFRGVVYTEWCGKDGAWRDVWLDPDNPPYAAKVAVKHAEHDVPDTAVVLYHEFVARDNDGKVTKQWEDRPAHMLGKCAEAGALRKAFPHDLSGLYTDDEMASVDNPEAGPVIDMPADPQRPDWSKMIAEREAAITKDPAAAAAALAALLDDVKRLDPNNGRVKNAIATALTKARKAQRDAEENGTAPAEPAEPKRKGPAMAAPRTKGALARLIGSTGITGPNARHYIAARLVGIESGLLSSFDRLTEVQARGAIDALTKAEEAGDLAEMLDGLLPPEDDGVWIDYPEQATKFEAEQGGAKS